ncbi:MAG: SAM-dependent methyltransferase [Zetaproteobacteria bacterium CG11_big_fil_rev_8_21_14_0_20_59_439]|nr:MAG: SAM-dependent methyltransferase [Zetaproteobacteria bacterium CG11_big_fil_rev_8_21_14_0_20_59_439]
MSAAAPRNDPHAYKRLRLWPHAADLLGIILNGPPPADKQMDRYFRSHRKLGKNDRGFVAETVYGCLRRLRLLRWLVTGQADWGAPNDALVAAELLLQGYPDGALGNALLSGGDGWKLHDTVQRIIGLDTAGIPPAIRASMPDWLFERLVAQFGESDAMRLSEALNQPATLDLRVNTLKSDRDTVYRQLTEEGATLEATPYSPLGLRSQERASLFRSEAFSKGLFEVQDEGSQLIAMLVEAGRREMVMDFCAGGGGKTLALGAAMQATGTLYACDVAHWRLKAFKPRLARAGLSSVRSMALASENDAHLKRLAGKMDRVLVDAPCSGTGTLRRNPDIKWRKLDLPELMHLQTRILAAAADLVKPGGRLVYSTCSLLDEENGGIVRAFLAVHPDFRLLDARAVFAGQGAIVPLEGEMMQLYPHRHATDGFFAAAMQRA